MHAKLEAAREDVALIWRAVRQYPDVAQFALACLTQVVGLVSLIALGLWIMTMNGWLGVGVLLFGYVMAWSARVMVEGAPAHPSARRRATKE